MAVQLPRLRRGLFGYRPKIVRTILTGREIMFARLWQRLQKAEAERYQARAELEACRAEIEVKNERARAAAEQRDRHAVDARSARAEADVLRSVNESLRGRIEQLEAEAAAAEADGASEDLWTALEAVERSLTEVIERGRREHEARLEAIEAASQELRAEAERAASWRADAEGVLSEVRTALGQLADVSSRPSSGGSGVPAMIRIPEVPENGSVGHGEIEAIQELYASRP